MGWKQREPWTMAEAGAAEAAAAAAGAGGEGMFRFPALFKLQEFGVG